VSPGTIKAKVVLEKVAWTRQMLDDLRRLPIADLQSFVGDPRNPAAAESFLRRALEALLDLGRHILAKGFGLGVVEYKKIAAELSAHEIIAPELGETFVEMAGYRNRLTHFYNEVAPDELLQICTTRLTDIEVILDAILAWLRANPDRLDRTV